MRNSPKPPDWLYAQGSSPHIASEVELTMLAELLRDLSSPVSRADSDEVGSDFRLILA